MYYVNTDGQQLHTTTTLGRTYMTTIPLCPVYLEGVLSLRRPLPFCIGGCDQGVATDGRTDTQKLQNDCSNPSAYALRRGLMTLTSQLWLHYAQIRNCCVNKLWVRSYRTA